MGSRELQTSGAFDSSNDIMQNAVSQSNYREKWIASALPLAQTFGGDTDMRLQLEPPLSYAAINNVLLVLPAAI